MGGHYRCEQGQVRCLVGRGLRTITPEIVGGNRIGQLSSPEQIKYVGQRLYEGVKVNYCKTEGVRLALGRR